VKHFHYEASRQKLGDLFTNGSSLLFRKSSEGLTDSLGFLADVKFVLGYFLEIPGMSLGVHAKIS